MIELLIGLALDDLASEHIDTESVLRLVAHRAWTEGHREGVNLSAGRSPTMPEPDQRS
jgi:hypothetical protein